MEKKCIVLDNHTHTPNPDPHDMQGFFSTGIYEICNLFVFRVTESNIFWTFGQQLDFLKSPKFSFLFLLIAHVMCYAL